MSDTVYCYHCGIRHPIGEARRIELKSGKRWRCIRSIEATRNSVPEREAFGRRTTELNRAVAAEKSKPLPQGFAERFTPVGRGDASDLAAMRE